MIETLFSALLVAAISALSFIAYKHPEPFRRNIGGPLLALTFLIVSVILGYFFGTISALMERLQEVMAMLPEGKELAVSLVAEISMSYTLIKYTLGVGFAVFTYLVLLILLPRLLDLNPNSQKTKEPIEPESN